MKGDTVIKLSEPVEANGETLTELVLKRPKAKHLRALDDATGEMGKTIALIARLAGVPPSTIDELAPADFMKAGDTVADFFPGLLTAGAPSSES